MKAFEYRRVKNDERDAADLADLLRMGRLPEAWIAPPATRELRELVRHRAKLVGLRSHCKAEVHAVLAKCGVQVQVSDLFGVGGTALLDRLNLAAPYAAKPPTRTATAGDTGHDERYAHTPDSANGAHRRTLLRNPDRVPSGAGIKALRPLPRSGYARALTPTPYLGTSPNPAKKQINGHKHLLTGPAPSGMTCGNASRGPFYRARLTAEIYGCLCQIRAIARPRSRRSRRGR